MHTHEYTLLLSKTASGVPHLTIGKPYLDKLASGNPAFPAPESTPRAHPKARPAARRCRPPCSKFVQSGIVAASLQHRFPTIRRITTRERTYNDAALNGPSPCGETEQDLAKRRRQADSQRFDETQRLPRRRSSCRLPSGRRARPRGPFGTPRQVGINHLQRNG